MSNFGNPSNTATTPMEWKKIHASDEEFCSSTSSSHGTSHSAPPRCISSGTNSDDGGDGGTSSAKSPVDSNASSSGHNSALVGKRRQNNPYACGNMFGPPRTTTPSMSLSHGSPLPTPHQSPTGWGSTTWIGESNNAVQSLNFPTCNSTVGLQQPGSEQRHPSSVSHPSHQHSGDYSSSSRSSAIGVCCQQQQRVSNGDSNQTSSNYNYSFPQSHSPMMNASVSSYASSASPYDANQQIMFSVPPPDPTHSTFPPSYNRVHQAQHQVMTHPSQHKRKPTAIAEELLLPPTVLDTDVAMGDASMTPPQQQQQQLRAPPPRYPATVSTRKAKGTQQHALVEEIQDTSVPSSSYISGLPPRAMDEPSSVSPLSLNKKKKNKRCKIPQHEKTMYLHLANMRAAVAAAATVTAGAGDSSEESAENTVKSTTCVSYFPWPSPEEIAAMNGGNSCAQTFTESGFCGLAKANLYQLPIQIDVSPEKVAWLFMKFGGVDVVHVSTRTASRNGNPTSTTQRNSTATTVAMQPQSFRVVFLESAEALRKAQELMDQRLLIDHNGVWYAASREEHSLMMSYLASSPRYVPKKPLMLEPLSHNRRHRLDVTTFLRPSRFVSVDVPHDELQVTLKSHTV